jgi:hypothetical protein
LVLYAQDLLTSCHGRLDLKKEQDDQTSATGGFIAIALKEKDEIDFELSFVLAEWETY